MKKTLQLILAVFMSMILLLTSVVPAFATEAQGNEGISVCLTNFDIAGFSFSVIGDEPGEATFAVTYNGREATFLYAKLTVTVEKKVLGLFWSDVGEWSGTCYDLDGMFYDYIEADGSGTYRANFKLTVYGNQGIADVVEDSIDCKYSG